MRSAELKSMEPNTNLAIGMAAAVSIVVTADMMVGHFVPGMPQVYATPMMILHMEMAAGLAVAAALPPGLRQCRHVGRYPASGGHADRRSSARACACQKR
jgi:hypothetical protein